MNLRLLGELGSHARGRTLAAAVGAKAGELPASGIGLGFGRQAQRDVAIGMAWARWCETPGRVLIVLPPYQAGVTAVPTSWEARRVDPLAGGETELGRVLAHERQYELRGQLTPFERTGGQVVTGAWRRHPAAGLFVITTLPLWSLAVLECREACRAWLADLLARGGTPRADDLAPSVEGPIFTPTPEDWTVLLHLSTAHYPSGDAALAALARSDVFRIDRSRASEALARLVREGLAVAGGLTAKGEALLAAGPYAAHARAIREMRDG